MVPMRRFVLSFLVLVMFTPGLACANLMHNTSQSKAPSHHEMGKDMPCCPKKSAEKSDMGTMLFKDCAKIDLQSAGDGALLKKAEIVKADPSYVLSHDLIIGRPGTAKTLLIRGPPDPPEILSSYPPVFLATQRLRV